MATSKTTPKRAKTNKSTKKKVAKSTKSRSTKSKSTTKGAKATTRTTKAAAKKKPATKKPATKKKAATKRAAEEQVTIDRRTKPRRTEAKQQAPASKAPASPQEETPKLERRAKVNRRRQIDPTTCERDYSDHEVAFMNALDDYKRKSGRMFPTCSEVLEVIRSLGYVQLTPTELAARRAAEPQQDLESAVESDALEALEESQALAPEEADQEAEMLESSPF